MGLEYIPPKPTKAMLERSERLYDSPEANIIRPLIQDGERDIYYRALSQFPNGHGYLADCILHARDTYQSILDRLHPTGLNISYNDGEDAEETDTSRYTAFENQIDSSRKRYICNRTRMSSTIIDNGYTHDKILYPATSVPT